MEIVDRDKLIKTEQQLIELLKFEKETRYDEHSKLCEICSLRKDINDNGPGFCERHEELR
jgi:hypothetical protein